MQCSVFFDGFILLLGVHEALYAWGQIWSNNAGPGLWNLGSAESQCVGGEMGSFGQLPATSEE